MKTQAVLKNNMKLEFNISQFTIWISGRGSFGPCWTFWSSFERTHLTVVYSIFRFIDILSFRRTRQMAMSYFRHKTHTRILRVCRVRNVTVYDPYGNVSDVRSLLSNEMSVLRRRSVLLYRALCWHGSCRRVRLFFNFSAS